MVILNQNEGDVSRYVALVDAAVSAVRGQGVTSESSPDDFSGAVFKAGKFEVALKSEGSSGLSQQPVIGNSFEPSQS